MCDRAERMRVLVIDDHAVVAQAVATRLDAEPDIDAVDTASSVTTGLEQVHRTNPDVIVVDADLGPDDGLDLVRRLHAEDPARPIVVMTGHADVRTAVAAIRAGARGFVVKSADPQQLVLAVSGAMHGETHIPPHLLTGVLATLISAAGPTGAEDERLRKLTAREREVLRHMMAGHDRATIAKDLYLSINTVRTHAKNLLAKLGVHSSLEAVHLALRAGVRPITEDEDDVIDLRQQR